MAIEILIGNPDFDQNHEHDPWRETEKKLIPVFPEQLDVWREQTTPVEHIYLSHPSEEYNLRISESFNPDGSAIYRATLKDRGVLTPDGTMRLEVETDISPEAFAYYKETFDLPRLPLLRAKPAKHVQIDFYEEGDSKVEFEHPVSGRAFLDRHPIDLVDVTGDRIVDNEWRAHMAYRRRHGGKEALVPGAPLDPQHLALQISQHHRHSRHTVMTIAGRSGSGKSTFVREVSEHLTELHPDIPVVTLSTDDYNRGKVWLDNHNGGTPWNDWDAAIVYDVELLALDIQRLMNGDTIAGRRFNFGTQAPELVGNIAPAPIILIEGIYAGSRLLDSIAHLRHEIPTPLATCIGRRLVRDFSSGRVNESLSDPRTVLRYLLENAEPAYQSQ